MLREEDGLDVREDERNRLLLQRVHIGQRCRIYDERPRPTAHCSVIWRMDLWMKSRVLSPNCLDWV